MRVVIDLFQRQQIEGEKGEVEEGLSKAEYSDVMALSLQLVDLVIVADRDGLATCFDQRRKTHALLLSHEDRPSAGRLRRPRNQVANGRPYPWLAVVVQILNQAGALFDLHEHSRDVEADQ